MTLGRLRIIDNPYIKYLLTRLRDRNTGVTEFRSFLFKLGIAMGYELARELEYREKKVVTPLGVEYRGVEPNSGMAIVAVLRAALPMAQGVLEILPFAKLGVVAAKRVENGADNYDFKVEVPYYNIPMASTVIVVDPMLASGSTMLTILGLVYSTTLPSRVFVVSAIAAKLGVKRVLSKYPVYLLVAEVDEDLDQRGYIVPGLGDAGDRGFG